MFIVLTSEQQVDIGVGKSKNFEHFIVFLHKYLYSKHTFPQAIKMVKWISTLQLTTEVPGSIPGL